MTHIPPHVFREYDIRGYVDRDLSEDFAYLLGLAFGELALENKKDRIAVGYDARHSSPAYAAKLMEGIKDAGLEVLSVGIGPTPQLYYAVFKHALGGGIQVTGSHNPSDMNGFKLCLGTHTLSGAEIQNLQERMVRLGSNKNIPSKSGKINELPITKQYIDELIANCKPHFGNRKLKVVVDGGNGVGGMAGPEILRGLGVEVIELYCEPDGSFPNHHPDPTVVKNLVDLISYVKEKADVGIAWDGDADRIGVVDENGKVIFGDMLLLIYARAILKKDPKATIIGDVKCSDLLFETLNNLGANAIMWKTGHSLIKEKLRETQGALAGEMSAHIFFKHRYFGFDDALYASARLCEILSQTNSPISTLLSDLPARVSTPEIRVECPEEIKFDIVREAESAFNEFKINTIDGVRITFDNGWGLVRASNTQPALVMRFEANTEKHLNDYQSLVSKRISIIRARLESS